MSYGQYIQNQNAKNTRNGTPLSRPAGYLVDGCCDAPKCRTVVSRGIENLCGDDPNSGCQGFYCDEHQSTLIYADEVEEYTNEELEAHGVTRSELDKHFETNADEPFTACTHKPAYFKKPQPKG